MENIHVLPTDKPSRLLIYDGKLGLSKSFQYGSDAIQNQNIYITSNSKFVRDEYTTDGIEVIKATPKLVDAQGLINRRDWNKIIITTDQELIKDGVQAINDEFLEWFVKNPSCEKIKVIKRPKGLKEVLRPLENDKYKIIIPKDEPFKHKVETIPAEEILANRSNAYEFIDFDLGLDELQPYIGPFLLLNGFEKKEDNVYTNLKCTVTVLEGCYEIIFQSKYGEVSTYTDSWSIPHLVGVLTWNDLIDKNYKK